MANATSTAATQHGLPVKYGASGISTLSVGWLQSFSLKSAAAIDDSVEDELGNTVTDITGTIADRDFSLEFVVKSQPTIPKVGDVVSVAWNGTTYKGVIKSIDESIGNREKGKFSVTAKAKGVVDYATS
jgi:hypothetical protein